MKLTQWHFPDRIYNALPYFYLCAGLVSMFTLGHFMAIFSGLILMSAGGVVWTLRYRYRRAFAQSAGLIHVPLSVKGGRVRSLFEISWRESFECGHPIIDGQHRRLFGLANDVINTVLAKQSALTVEALMDELIAHITEHFCVEEAILAKTQHPLSLEHQAHHRALRTRVKKLRDNYVAGQMDAGEIVGFLAHDVIADHILKEDIKWSAVDRKALGKAGPAKLVEA